MFTAGMTLGAVGLGSLVTGAALWVVSNREWNRAVELSLPGPTGFPDRTWNEFTIRGAQRKWRSVALHPMLPHAGLSATFRF